jgi:uncharacterized OB-fold protein
MSGEERIYPVVPATPGSEPYWEGANAGKLLLGYCKSCNKSYYYPRGVCPMCLSTDVEMRESKGTGTIYTYSVMRPAKPVYVIAYVTLDEGPSMMTNIVDCDPESVKIGQKVKAVFKPREDGTKIVCFTPA